VRKSGCHSPGKHPRTKNGLKDASTDPNQIQTWWLRWPQASIGLVTGAASGTFVVDADNEPARQKLDEFGVLPPTRTVKTARGWHLYFRYPTDGVIRNDAGKLCSGIDIRGEGGYVLAPPSLHPSGVRYELRTEDPIAPAPEWLLERLRRQLRVFLKGDVTMRSPHWLERCSAPGFVPKR